jgi:hypothetical protein
MALRIPLNLIIKSKYTLGGEYIVKKTYEDYQGYYYEFNDKTFAGKEFSTDAPLLIKKDSENVDALLINSNSKVNAYGKIVQNFKFIDKQIVPQAFSPTEPGAKFFAKKANQNPSKIIHISEETFEENKSNTLYVFTSIDYDPEFGFAFTPENTKLFPEIKEYLKKYSNISDEDL